MKRYFLVQSMKRLPFSRVTNAYVATTYAALAVGSLGFLVGLWNATTMELNEKGYYLTLLAFGLFAAISLQKSLRDRTEGIAVTKAYLGTCYAALGLAVALLLVGLWNANLLLSEKGFYGMSFVLALFCAVTAQKNLRDRQAAHEYDRLHQPVANLERDEN